jgi:hypothetical protein
MIDAIVNNKIKAAEYVVESGDADANLKHIACKFLMNHYKSIGDANNLMRYYIIAGGLPIKSTAIYDEMGL